MPRTDRASRLIAAAPERVFAALVDPEALTAWLPPQGMTGRFEHFDPRPGGSYRLVLTHTAGSGALGKAGADTDIVKARFVDIVPAVRVVQEVDFVSDDPAFADMMTMTWELTAVDGRTTLTSRRTTSHTAFLPKTTRWDWHPRWRISLATSRGSRLRCSEIRRPDPSNPSQWHACEMDRSTQLSPDAHQRLTEELAERSGSIRRHISELIERARELGDLSENGDYHAAKNEQGMNEAHVRQLEATLKYCVVVESIAADKVETGTVVEVLMEGDDEPSTYLVGSIEERGTGYDVLSPGSPLGKALLGHAPGDVVTYQAPSGQFNVEIVSVRPPG